MFQAVGDEAERKICESLWKKVDLFINCNKYNWLLVESTGKPSRYVTAMLSYLSQVFASQEQIPERIRMTAARAATIRIAYRIRNMIMDPEVKQMSAGALDQVNLDVMQFEKFESSNPISGLRPGQLTKSFASLRQLLDVLIDWDWSCYLQDVGSAGGAYPLVSAGDLACMIKKIKGAEERETFLTVQTKADRDRIKWLDIMIKKLRLLQKQGL